VNQNYGGCGVDTGWFVVSTTGGTKVCPWEQLAGSGTRILYANGTTAANWSTAAAVGAADTMMVLVR
jgi:hypothetical protein